MDGNPIALRDPLAYRHYAIEHVKTLRHLDLKRITDAERRAVAIESQREGERKRAAEKDEILALERRKFRLERNEAIRAAERQWIDQKFTSPASKCGSQLPSHVSSVLTGYAQLPGCATKSGRDEDKCSQLWDFGGADSTDATYCKGRSLSAKVEMLPTARSCVVLGDAQLSHSDQTLLPGKLSNQGHIAPRIGYYEVEIGGAHREERVLQLYGEAWDCLDSPKIVGTCTALVCRFVSIDRVVEKLRPHAHNFAKLRKATFGDNAILTFHQTLHLANVCQALPLLVDLEVESNPVCSLSLLRSLVCANFLNIERFNGIKITQSEQALHSAQLGLFCVRARGTDRQKGTTQMIVRCERDGGDALKRIVTSATTNALLNEEIRRALERCWPAAVHHLIDECLEQSGLCDLFFASEPMWQ